MHVCPFHLQKTHKIDFYSWKRARLFCREVFNAHQTDGFKAAFQLLFFFYWPQLERRYSKKKHIRCDQCLIPKQLLLLVLSLSLHVWTFQASNLLPSWESLWHSSSWKSSPVKQPDLYTFLTCASALQHIPDLCSPTHGSRGRVICYTPHFLS